MTKPLIVITGASSGIGAAMAKVFSPAGYPLALLSRNQPAMENLALPQTLCIETDVTNYDAVVQAIHIAEEKFGPTHCLINNAGFGKGGEFTTISHDAHENMVNVNVLGVIHGIEAVLPGMQTRKAGTIINISSIADRNARPSLAVYAATKAAVKSLSESLRMANTKYGIRVCHIAPAKIKTPLLIASALHDDCVIPAESVAQAARWIYEQPPFVCIRDLVIAPTEYEA